MKGKTKFQDRRRKKYVYNYTSPEGLRVFLSSQKSEINDPKNRNREKCNLPTDELNALKELINLQKKKTNGDQSM